MNEAQVKAAALRETVAKQEIAGFSETVLNPTSEKIALKIAYKESSEAYFRVNQWEMFLGGVSNDQEIRLQKLETSVLNDGLGFSVASVPSALTPEPELVTIRMDETDTWGTEFYAKDYEQSNWPETAGKIMSSVYRKPERYWDIKVAEYMKAEAGLNALITPATFDINVAIDATNGEALYNLMLEQLIAFQETGALNKYEENDLLGRETIMIGISERASELLVASKRIYIDQSGLANAGGFGSTFRDVRIKVMRNMPADLHVIYATDRAVKGLRSVRDFKKIDGSTSELNWLDKMLTVHDFGIGTWHEDFVTSIIQPTAPVKEGQKNGTVGVKTTAENYEAKVKETKEARAKYEAKRLAAIKAKNDAKVKKQKEALAKLLTV